MFTTNFHRSQHNHSGTALNRKQDGFTLIELSIVLVIAGFFMVGLIKAYELYQKDRIQREMDAKMDRMRSALAQYIQDKQDVKNVSDGGEDAVRYPCPADPALSPGDTGYGKEAKSGVNTCETSGEVVKYTKSGDTVYAGAFPARTVGLPAQVMADPYGNKYTYVVSKSAIKQGALENNTPEKMVRINDQGTNGKSLFALFSHGENGAGAYTRSGSYLAVSDTDAAETQNAVFAAANGNGSVNPDLGKFRSRSGHYLADSSQYFDDTAAFSLVDEKDDEWWTSTSGAGQHLTNKNPGHILIDPGNTGSKLGVATNAPKTELDVDGAAQIGSSQNILNQGNEGYFQKNSNSAGKGYLEVPWIYTNGCIEGDRKGKEATSICLGSNKSGTSMNSFTENDEISLNTKGQPRLFVDKNGDVGLGTDSPSSQLNIADGNVHMDSGKIFVRDEKGLQKPSFFPSSPYGAGASVNVFGPNDGSTADRTSGYSAVSNGGWSMYRATSITDGSLGQAPLFRGVRKRGSLSSPQPPDKGDGLAVFEGSGFTLGMGAGMAIKASENQSNSQRGSEIVFRTIPNGGKGAKERVTIKENGQVVYHKGPAMTSDRSLKTNIHKSEGLNLIKQLRGVRFEWKDDGEASRGVIAQDVAKVMPELVETDADTGHKSVNYQALAGPLIESVKTLAQRNANLKAANSEQDEQIANMQERLARLEKATGLDNKHAAFGSGGASTALWALVLLLAAGLGVQSWRYKRTT